jgi:hypothetical protein
MKMEAHIAIFAANAKALLKVHTAQAGLGRFLYLLDKATS